MPVANAAPATPKSIRPTNTASSMIFVQPAIIVEISPSFGFSAAIKKLWNTFWSIKAVVKDITILP